MFAKIKELVRKYKELLLYVLFGALTTIVNYLVFFPLYNVAHMSAAGSNGIAWCAAVIFAYITNKLYVFTSRDWSLRAILPELGKFVACRIGSGMMETLIIYITVDGLTFNGNIMKLLTSILVIIFNYVASKLFVFNRK